MKFKQFTNKFIIRLEKGEEVVASLTKFCQEQNILLGTVSGIGATNQAVIGLFKTEQKEYISQEFTGDYEIVSLVGNISRKNGEVYAHLHVTLADQNNIGYGGHLTSAVVSATFEALLEKIDGQIDRQFDQEVGLESIKDIISKNLP